MTITKPMLASAAKDLNDLKYPLIASPKLDGIRCLKVDGKVVSRSFKPIRNDYIRGILEQLLPEGADGEIMAGDNFQQVASSVMSKAGEPAFKFHMFDLAPEGADAPGYQDRIQAMTDWKAANDPDGHVVVVETVVIGSVDELLAFEAKCLEAGYEGVMTRRPDSPYKCGRATIKSQDLLKVKRFEDSEARVVGFVEQQLNTNEAKKDAFGRTERSSSKAGKVGKNTLGKFVVEEAGDKGWTQPFRVGTGLGLTQELRQEIWDNQDRYLGKLIKYKYQPHGVKDAPRLPIFLGFRDEDDL
jgi:DNA ligase-1